MNVNRRPNFARITWMSLASVSVLLTVLWFGGRFYLGQSVMPYSGSQVLPGLDRPVEVLFDGRGIPRIYAASDRDAMRTLGWLHAGERLFQMELIRRAAHGELSELIGPAGLEADLLHRSIGFARRVREQPPSLAGDVHGLLDAYVGGINGYMANAGQLPPEFVLLQRAPEPWTVADIWTIAYYQSWYPNTLVQRLAESWREIAAVWGEPASTWLSSLPEWMVASVPGQRLSEGSNSWVVGPGRSASGHALHAADPHLDYTLAPGMWYAVGLHSEQGLDVLGVTAPGLPFVAMGHNGQIAWSFTVAPVDVFELYRQSRHPEDPDRVAGPGGWEPIVRRVEQFGIRDQTAPIRREFEYTARGLVIDSRPDAVLTLHWAGFELEPGALIPNGLAITRSSDFDGFHQAASNMAALSVNWVYSDRAGNIGYVQSTPIPRRRHLRFFQVLDATDPINLWDGFHPVAERPFAFNPDQGWLANANNQAAGPDWPYVIPGFYKHLRMRRARAWLEPERVLDQTDMHRMQLDQVSDRALAWKGRLADVAEHSGRVAMAAELRAWDGGMRANSETAGLFARWWQHLPRHLFKTMEPPDWRIWRQVLDEWLHHPPAALGAGEIDLDAAALAALEDALRPGIRPLGTIQTLTIEHPLAKTGVLDRWLGLSRGPIPLGGDAGSLNVTYPRFVESTSTLSARAGASMRFVLDWSDVNRFTLNLTLGQSGHPLSRHFDDFLPSFLDGQPWTVPWTREAVEASSVSRLELVPVTSN